jgi:hypothetical protein
VQLQRPRGGYFGAGFAEANTGKYHQDSDGKSERRDAAEVRVSSSHSTLTPSAPVCLAELKLVLRDLVPTAVKGKQNHTL